MPSRGKNTPKTKKSVEVVEGKASVTYNVSITKNTGDFESLKIQAGITVPYGADDDILKGIDDLLVVCRDKVISRLSTDLGNISESM